MSLFKKLEKVEMTEEEKEEQRLQFRSIEIFTRVVLEIVIIMLVFIAMIRIW